MPRELREQAGDGTPATPRRLDRMWDLLGEASVPAPDVPGTDAAWAALQQRLDAAPIVPGAHRAADRPARGGLRRARRVLGVTALLAACVAGGLWLWGQPVMVTAPAGAQAYVTLPDGSRAALNSGSRLTYRRGFQAWPFVAAPQRAVTLAGEAFFEVVHDPHRPFTVETFNARVEVLGTQFNVWARPEAVGGETRVVLAAGAVRVRGRDGASAPLTLREAGAVAHVGQDAGRITTSRVAPVERALAWRTQGFAAIDRPLASILAEVERRYGVAVEAEDGIALAEPMTVFYGPEATAEIILHDLCLAQGCRYRPVSRGYVLFPSPAEATP